MVEAQKADSTFNQISLVPGQITLYPFALKAPVEKGQYEVLFSIRTTPFEGGKNSRIIHLTVE
jgi:hypothetical protein